jgi:uncharacterized SAM-binding protein YcdF (DUF218 family)
MPPRAEEAATVFRRGYAPEVWVSRPTSPASELEELGIRYVGEEEYSREILVHECVPEAVVHILPDPIVDTEQEMEEVARAMRRAGKAKVIIVTSPQHTRRVRALWKKLVGENPTLVVHAAHEDPFVRHFAPQGKVPFSENNADFARDVEAAVERRSGSSSSRSC